MSVSDFFEFGCRSNSGSRCRQRPYFVECTRSHPNSEVKRRKARSVLGWGTAREALRVLLAFLIFPRGSLVFYRINRAERNITVAVLAQRYRRGDAFAQSLFLRRFSFDFEPRTSRDAVRLSIDFSELLSPTAILRRIHPIPSELGS